MVKKTKGIHAVYTQVLMSIHILANYKQVIGKTDIDQRLF